MKITNNYYHPLMQNNILSEDISSVIRFLKSNKRIVLTQSIKVKEFEEKWSKWLGVRYSVFVNSGSSANLLTLLALKILYGDDGEIILPSLTWISDVASVIQNNFKPIFVDINPRTLCMNEDEIFKKILDISNALIMEYNNEFLKDDFCSKIALVYEKKLSNFNIKVLRNLYNNVKV